MSYDKIYSEVKHVFGTEPEGILINSALKIDKARPVLDLGSGQGRNAIFMAKKGFSVDAIDPSKIAVDTLLKIAEEGKLNIRAYQKSHEDFVPENPPYSAILIFGLLQILDWNSINLLLEKVEEWTTKGSLIYLTAFSIKDASFFRYRKAWNVVGKNSFSDHRGGYRTFLEPNEIVRLFKKYNVIHHWEGLGPKHQHGSDPVEQHELIELIIEK